jgi:glycosyltransferase involved in cell wall biosynthesis
MMTSRSYILFISPLWFGHIPSAMRLYWQFFLERGWEIHHLTDRPGEAAEFCARHFGADAARLRHAGIAEPPGQSLSAIKRNELRWAALGQAVERVRRERGEPALVFHGWADLITHNFLQSKWAREALPLPWGGICVHPVELRVKKSWKRRWWEMIPHLWRYGLPTESRLRSIRVPNLRWLLLLDDHVLDQARAFFPGVRISGFPDAANVAVDEGFRLPGLDRLRAEGRPLIAVIGFLDRRKGFLRLMEAARAAPGNWGFLFAGRIAWDDLSADEKQTCQRFIENPPANTVVHAEFMETEEQLNKLISMVDFHYVAYEDFFHSSHIQVKAASYRKLCLAGPKHLISERTTQYDLGWTLKDFSTGALIDFLSRTDRAALEQKAVTARFDEFSRMHSIQRMEEVLAEILATEATP